MFRSICDLYYNQYSYWLYKDVHVNLCFIRLVDISSFLVPCVLCRAKYNRQWSNREYASDTQMEIQPNVKYFCLFVCKIKNFVNTWHCSINTIFILCQDISTCLETERKAHFSSYSISKARTNKSYICQQCTYIVYMYGLNSTCCILKCKNGKWFKMFSKKNTYWQCCHFISW
jgi:hypothetical protein